MANYDFSTLAGTVGDAVVTLSDFEAMDPGVESGIVQSDDFGTGTTVEYISLGSDGSAGSGVLLRTIPALVRVTQ